jgi:hypothetical protein
MAALSPLNAQMQLQRIQIRVRAERAHINSDPLSAATFVGWHGSRCQSAHSKSGGANGADSRSPS